MVSMDVKDVSYRASDLKLFVRDVRDRQNKKRPITVRSWATVKDVKDTIQQLMHIPASAQRLYFGPLLTSGMELPNHRTLHDVGIYRSGESFLLDIKGSKLSQDSTNISSIFSLRSSSGDDICISSSMIDSTPKALRTLAQQARRGFNLGLKPDFVLDGSGGTYFLHDSRKNRIAVFKPADEEPYAENNPRGYIRQPGQPLSLRNGIVPGEACIREVAAYLLDHGGVSGVPMTTLAEARHPNFNTNGSRLNVSQGGACFGAHSIAPLSPVKTGTIKKPGSFQQYVNCEFTMDDISPSMISVDEVHKIAILDIRIMNADRNSANLLCRRRPDNNLELIPIDHGFCLRSVCDVSWMDWCWLDWPQLKQPLSEKLKKYVLNLNIENDARLLQERLNICHEAVDNFRASSSLLKAGVKAGLTLYDIAVMCCRNDNLAETPSMLERLFTMASELSVIAVDNERWHHAAASRALAEQLTPKTCYFQRTNSKRRFLKSASSADFALPFSDFSDSAELASATSSDLIDKPLSPADSPGMVQSSASDSSVEPGDNICEKEDCEQWAAGVIANVSVDQIEPTLTRRQTRSSSVSSDDSSEASSPKGFWHVRPCSFGASDDESITWSPVSSPRMLVDIGAENNTRRSVRFADDHNLPNLPFLPPLNVNVSKLKKVELGVDQGTTLVRSDSCGLTRSKSYSALSQAPRSSDVLPIKQKRTPDPSSDIYADYRKYFLNFIDMVIARETSAAVHRSKQVRTK